MLVSDCPSMSMNPGATTMPRASMLRRAGWPSRCPTAAILPARMPMSPAYHGEPVPSMMRPLRITMSYGLAAAAVMAEGGQRARAKLQCISINGGLLQLQHQLSAGDFVEIAFHTRSGAIHAMAEMLHPTRKFQSACLQPFRFIALADDDHRKLRMALDSALDRSFLDPVSEQIQAPPGF